MGSEPNRCDSLTLSCLFFSIYLSLCCVCVCVCVCVCAGQVMTAGIAEILNGYSLKAVLRRVPGEKHTRAAEDTHDDSYLGNMHLQNKHTHTKPHAETTVLIQIMIRNDIAGVSYSLPRVNCLHVQPISLSLGYSVAVGEFTGDSEQGEKSPQFITTKPHVVPEESLATGTGERSRTALSPAGCQEGALWRGVCGVRDKEWTAVWQCLGQNSRRSNENCLCMSGSRPRGDRTSGTTDKGISSLFILTD